MGYELTDFLVSLAEPRNLARYADDPEGFMRDARLSEEQRRAVADGDGDRVRELCAQETPRDTARGGEERAHAGATATKVSVKPGAAADYYYDHLFAEGALSANAHQLVFVGTGINASSHMTTEAYTHIVAADKVLFCVGDPVVERQLRLLNPNTDDMYRLYGDGKPRRNTYVQMVETIMDAVRQYRHVCAVFYGHPGIFVSPTYRAIKLARSEGHRAYMLPAVSSLDCLFSDIGFDPARHSCQIVEATDMLVRRREPDTSAAVIVFQVGVVGEVGYRPAGYDNRNLRVLADYLLQFYGGDHDVILYEASQYPVSAPTIERVCISELAEAKPSAMSTLYIPPKDRKPTDEEMLARLGLRA